MPLPLSDADLAAASQDQSGLPVDLPPRRVYINTADMQQPQPDAVNDPYVPPTAASITDKLLGLNGQERYQLWPERLIRDALSAPHDVMNSPTPVTSQDLIKPAMDVSALAGTGGLAGAGEDAGAAALGSGPFLRPALKYEGKIYKAPVGGQHMDAIPEDLRAEFTKQAMNGDDISNFDFGFMNHKGQFLSRENALKYAIDQGLLSPHDAKFGALTSTLMADSSKEGAAIGALEKSKSPFYSALEKNVADVNQSKMTGDQWLGTLANKPGVKPEELDWTGVKDFLKERGNQPVTKAELQEHLQNNKVELIEKNSHTPNPKLDEMMALDAKARHYEAEGETDAARAIREQIKAIPSTGDFNPRYKSYQLPGGENYREKLLTLPSQNKFKVVPNPEGSGFSIKYPNGEYEKGFGDKPASWATENLASETGMKYVQGKARGKMADELRAKYGDNFADKWTDKEKQDWNDVTKSTDTYKSSHWDEPNVLAHIRTNDRDVGGVPSHHIEEIQSDWHQQGRDKGYTNSPIPKVTGWENTGPIGSGQQVPDAPFKKSWPELAMKRAIRQAVEEGKSRVSWTPGEAQAARYDLSKSVDKIAVPMVNKDGTRSVRIDAKNSTPFKLMVDKDSKVLGMSGVSNQFSGKPLSEVVGKEMAEKIMKLENSHEFSGDGLKIGGEGMKGFYDEMLPKMVERIGKKYGVKVKEGESITHKGYPENISVYDKDVNHVKDFKTMEEARAFLNNPANGVKGGSIKGNKAVPPKTDKVHYFDIPEKMKQDVLTKGFSLFSNPLPIPTQREK